MTSKITPTWLNEFQAAAQCRERCIIFTFNYEDYVLESGIPILFEHFVKNDLSLNGYELILEFSLAEGIVFYQPNQHSDVARKFEKFSGLSVHEHTGQNSGAETESLKILKGFDRLLKQSELRVAIIIKYGEHIVPNSINGGLTQSDIVVSEELFRSWATNPVIASGDNLAIVLAKEGFICESVKERWRVIKVDLPKYSTRLEFIELLKDAREQKSRLEFAQIDKDLKSEVVAKLTSGLSLRAIEKIFRRGSATPNGILNQDTVKAAKANEIRNMCGELLEVFESEGGLETIAGMHNVKKYFALLKKQISCEGVDLVRAILMVGVPGVGKSFCIRAFAKELGFNCVALRNVRSMWVGESERNLERAFNTIEALSPVVLFFDEIDQALGQRGTQGDSGVSQRMLARIWEFMALERLRGKIIFVAATNMPSLLDPATKDRFGVTIPFLLPSHSEMVELIPTLAIQLGLSFSNDADINSMADILTKKRISPRQLLDVLSMARVFSLEQAEESKLLSQEAIIRAANSFRPNANPIEIERITLEAINMTTFSELLPWADLAIPFALPAFTEGVVDQETGNIDYDLLHERLNILQRSLWS